MSMASKGPPAVTLEVVCFFISKSVKGFPVFSNTERHVAERAISVFVQGHVGYVLLEGFNRSEEVGSMAIKDYLVCTRFKSQQCVSFHALTIPICIEMSTGFAKFLKSF